MSEETKIQCPACTAELPAGTVQCPWCGYLLTPKVEESHVEAPAQLQEEVVEPEPTLLPEKPEPIPLPEEPTQSPVPEEPEPQPPAPEASVFSVAEPGLSELPPEIRRAPASTLKAMGIFLTIFSFLALGFFIFQVLKGTLPQSVLLLPIFGMMLGLISVAIAQRR